MNERRGLGKLLVVRAEGREYGLMFVDGVLCDVALDDATPDACPGGAAGQTIQQ